MKKEFNYSNLIRFILSCIFVFTTANSFSSNPEKPEGKENTFKVTIIYDNYSIKEDLKADWGFSCLVEGSEKTILFDAGASSKIFLHNFNTLKIDPKKIDMVFVSHEHFDHMAGLEAFLQMNNSVSVYIINSFPEKSKEMINASGAGIVYEPRLKEIIKDVYVSGTMGTEIEEQALILNTDKGLVVITGCSHPGIIEMLRQIKTDLNKDIYMVFGGFHLMRMSDSKMKDLIAEMKELGVKKCGATHCTGDKQINLFKEAFGENYVQMGVGRIIEL